MTDIGGGAAGTNKRIPDARDVAAAAFLAGAVSRFSSHRAFNCEHFSTVFTAVIVLSHVLLPFKSRVQFSVQEPAVPLFQMMELQPPGDPI